MIIDSSAVIAILRQEDGAEHLSRAIASAPSRIMPAPTYLETCMVFCGRKGPEGQVRVDSLLSATGIDVRPFSEDAARLAVAAFLKYGKGRGHPAQLNFGDCVSYAFSKLEAMPLLFRGDDFRLTDVEAAL